MDIKKNSLPDHRIFEAVCSVPARDYIIPRNKTVEEWIDYLKKGDTKISEEDRNACIAAFERAIVQKAKLINFSNSLTKGEEGRRISLTFSFKEEKHLDAFLKDMEAYM